ncbi:MAG: cytochrome c class [Caulobacter sp.]|nr:cytochrome c class [Caulobacter sp.]
MTPANILRATLAAGLLVAFALPSAVAPAAAQAVQGGDTGGGVVRVAKPVTGAQVYQSVCQACHMQDGKGGSGAGTIPALASNPRLAGAAYPIMVVSKGKGAMPSFTDLLSDAQMANVITYVRTNFGNSYAKPVSEAEVARIAHPPAAARD